ncbi:hypothetical protein ACWDCB_40465 [Streptomyces sp. NPDC001178]
MTEDFQVNVDGTHAAFSYYEMAVVPSGEHPGYADCVLMAKTQSQSDSSVTEGRSLCFITGGGHPALLTVTAIRSSENKVNVTVRVWRSNVKAS